MTKLYRHVLNWFINWFISSKSLNVTHDVGVSAKLLVELKEIKTWSNQTKSGLEFCYRVKKTAKLKNMY